MKTSKIVKLVVSILLPLAIGGVAGIFTSNAIPGWFATLVRPSFAPPNWLFGPVWTTLYLVMGISLFLIWTIDAGKERNQAIFMFLLQLLFNFAWSFFFFYFKMIDVALIDIVVLWISIIVMLRLFFKLKPWAAYINIPYLLWVSFATALNAAYYILN